MSTVVGLVKSRLRSKSRRGKSLDGGDVVVYDGNDLVRYRSLRQQALADPVDDAALSPTVTQARTPTDLDPAFLAEGLQGSPTQLEAPPVPPIPSEIPAEFFPARQSSLGNRKAYAIKAHRRTSSQTKDGGMARNDSAESQPRRRYYTISSPSERPRETDAGYFQSFPLPPATEEPVEPSREPSDAHRSTLTARLYGTIAENRRSTELAQEPGSASYNSRVTPEDQQQTNNYGARKPRSTSFSLAYRPRAATFDGPRSPMRPDVQRPEPLRVSKTKEPYIPEHVRLPEGFELTDDERTSVDTVWHPAVEKQTIQRERTEVVRPVIEKDVHVHHYYEYEQPVQVTEVLAPKHYRLDPATGEKVEIESPVGWQLPEPLTVQSPDISKIKGTQRHYVVDDDHPRGKLEDWPLPESGAVTTWI